ncbi:MAG: hypothetical protein HKN95_00750 [Acidimicrobiia bacterium]|nr:hypothetical protein [Acidimicrobiia bacterium]
MPVLAQIDLSFVDRLTESFKELGSGIGNFIPKLVVALLIIWIGSWLARIARKWLEKGLEKIGARKLTEAAGIEPMLGQAGTSGPRLVAQVLYYLVMIIFLQIATDVLGIDRLSALLDTLIAYLPLVVVAILILFVAGAVAGWAAGVVRPLAESRNMGWLADIVRWAIVVIGALAALDTLNFAPSVTENIQATLLQWLPLSILATGAVAFGIGGIDTAKKWWAKLDPKTDKSQY